MPRLLLLVGSMVLMLVASVPAAAQEAKVKVLSPMEGEEIVGSSFVIRFQVEGIKIVPSTIPVEEAGKHPEANQPGEGHLHFMLDLQPLVVWDKDEPYTFTNVPPGDHQLMVELVNNDHSPLTPPVVQQFRIRTEMPQEGASGETPAQLPNTGATDARVTIDTRWMLMMLALLIVALGVGLRQLYVLILPR